MLTNRLLPLSLSLSIRSMFWWVVVTVEIYQVQKVLMVCVSFVKRRCTPMQRNQEWNLDWCTYVSTYLLYKMVLSESWKANLVEPSYYVVVLVG